MKMRIYFVSEPVKSLEYIVLIHVGYSPRETKCQV
jgi:hypothetical protein